MNIRLFRNPGAYGLRRCHRIIPGFVLVGLIAAGPLHAASERRVEPTSAPVFYMLPANVEILRLENGLDLVLLRNPSQPMVGIYTQVKVGSAREDHRTSGMSHMLEHLLFNGTEKYTQEQLYDAADNAGAYNNANTTDFYTNFMMVLPAESIETGLDLQSQMLFHSTIPAEKFGKEQGIVLGEIVQGRDSPGRFTEDTLREVMYGNSSLELPTVGTRATIANMNRDDVDAFYRRWYVPNNMVVTIAGNFDRVQVLELLEKFYGSVAPGTIDRALLRPAAPIERTRSVVRRGGDSRELALVFAAPEWGATDYFPFLILNELLTMDGNGILTRALDKLDRASRPAVNTWWEPAPGFGRLALRFTLAGSADPAAIYPLVQAALAGAAKNGIEDADLLGIARLSATRTLLNREQLRMTGIYTADALVQGGPDFFASYLERLKEVSGKDVLQAANRWLAGAPCLAVLIEPEPAAAPADSAAAGQAGAPRVERTVLSSGAVVISQTNPDSPLMAIHLTVRNRAQLDLDLAGAGAVDLVHRLLDEGTADCDRACLAARLRALGAEVKSVDDPRIPMDDYYTTGRFSFIRVECAAEHGRDVLRLLAANLREAAFDKADFERLRAARLTELGRQQGTARATANALLNRQLYGDHPLVQQPEGDPLSLAALGFDQVRNVFRRAFMPENLIIAVVGPASHDQLCGDLMQLFPGTGRPTGPLAPLPETRAPGAATATVGGQMAAIRLGSVCAVEPADASALGLLVAILSDRMGMDLRETRGLSYSVGAGLDLEGGQGTLTAWLNPPQERREEGLAALRDFIADFDPATITPEELLKVHTSRRGRSEMRRLSSLGQAYYLAMAELDGDLSGYQERMADKSIPTVADLTAASAKYLRGRPWIEVVVD